MCHFPSIKKFRDPFLTYKVSFSSFFRLKKDTIQIFLQTSRETILDRKILERMDVKAPAAKQQRLLLSFVVAIGNCNERVWFRFRISNRYFAI